MLVWQAKLSEMILDQKLNGTLDQGTAVSWISFTFLLSLPIDVFDVSMSGVGVLIVFDQEQAWKPARILPLASLKNQAADVVVMCLKVSSSYDNSLKTIKNTSEARRLELFLVLSSKCTVHKTSRGLGHTLWTGKAACMRTSLRSANGYGFSYFSASEKVYVHMFPVKVFRIHSKCFL